MGDLTILTSAVNSAKNETSNKSLSCIHCQFYLQHVDEGIKGFAVLFLILIKTR